MDAFNKARLELEPSKKRRRKEIKAERQSAGDPSVLNGYLGPWADYKRADEEDKQLDEKDEVVLDPEQAKIVERYQELRKKALEDTTIGKKRS